MTTKLTLTIDDAVIYQAKKHDKIKGKSHSVVVENDFISSTNKETMEETISSQILKLMGSIELLDDFDYKIVLAKSLIKKCLK